MTYKATEPFAHELDGETFEEVASAYNGCYDWSYFGLLKDSAGRLFTASDSGCSCNSPLDMFGRSDLNPVPSYQEAIKRCSEYGDTEMVDQFRDEVQHALGQGWL